MATIYVAAEKLVNWDKEGEISVDKQILNLLIEHVRNNRFVVYFAPTRFGLLFENRGEVEEAWCYFSNFFRQNGFEPDNIILFNEEVEEYPFSSDIQKQSIQNSVAFIYSDAQQDEILSLSLGFQLIREIPSNISSQLPKINIQRSIRTLATAAIRF